MTQSPTTSAKSQVEDMRAASCDGLFLLSPALSLGERVNRSLRGEQSRSLGSPLRYARCSLALPPSRRSGALARREGGGERVRVRGIGANASTPYENESHSSETETRRARRRDLADPA